MSGHGRKQYFDMGARPNLPPGQLIAAKPQMSEKVKLSLFPEGIVGRTEDEIKEIESFVENLHPIKEATCVIRRHKFVQKVGSIFVPETARELYDKRTVTGTILKMRLSDAGTFLDKNGNVTYPECKVGDYVLFTQYAPFFAYEKFPDIQVIHAEDILFTLKQLPPGVEDRW